MSRRLMRNKTWMRRNIHPKCSCMMPSWHKNGNSVFLFQAWHLHRQVICGSNLAYLQCGPHPCTPPAAIRDWNSFHHDWNWLEFFPILSTHCLPLIPQDVIRSRFPHDLTIDFFVHFLCMEYTICMERYSLYGVLQSAWSVQSAWNVQLWTA